ncbi:MAG: DUF2075 domain-containing protein [Lachnospiraceae bacterium]|nr:DUF2075 domain-containing protein [Lachnospiraceae bacterium]
MKPVNIYSLTRLSDEGHISRLERQLSGRNRYLKIKEWEIDGLRIFSEKLEKAMPATPYPYFFYSFTMPKLGKEFDLLRVSTDSIVNIELKSGDVTDAAILKQLLQNRYYLASLGISSYFYTYVSKSDRLVRLSNSGKLVDTDFEELSVVLSKQKELYEGDVEDLFKEDQYLISPLTDPARFLRREYFLTSQQNDIKKQILKDIKTKEGRLKKEVSVHGFTGLPGTGKTILLYDIAMQLSWNEHVCVLHFGSHAKELEQLDERLKRIDFYYIDGNEDIKAKKEYCAILVDEGHRVGQYMMNQIMCKAKEWSVPVIFSYDREDAISPYEIGYEGAKLIESLPGFVGYRLTNRIRLNSELSSFINAVVGIENNHRKEYPSVSLAYAGDDDEVQKLIRIYLDKGYIFICDGFKYKACNDKIIEASQATCKEFDKVLMIMDEDFDYDSDGYLREKGADKSTGLKNPESQDTETLRDKGRDSKVRKLYHGLSRAKKNLAIIVKNNKKVFEGVLFILQKNK